MESVSDDRSNLGVVIDPTIKIEPGSKLRSIVPEDKKYLSIGDIKELMKEMHSKNLYLNDYLEGSELILPSLEVPTRNPELEARTQKLKKMLAQQDYNRMTQNVDFTNKYKPTDSIGYQMKQINSGLIGVFQFVVSIGAAFLFGFMGLDMFLGLSWELPVKLASGLICTLIVATAELYFLLVNLDLAEAPQETNMKHQHEDVKIHEVELQVPKLKAA